MGSLKTYKEVEKLSTFSLFSELWQMASIKSNGEGFTDGTECYFSHQEISMALSSQGITEADMEEAIKHCFIIGQLKKIDDTFFVTRNGLANYHARLRRIQKKEEKNARANCRTRLSVSLSFVSM